MSGSAVDTGARAGRIGGVMRPILMGIGLVSIAAGAVAIVIPGLPTTPFVLLSAFLFSKSSRRLNAWVRTHPTYGPMIRDIAAGRGVTRKTKIVSVLIAWTFLGTSAVLVDPVWLKIFLISLGIIKLIAMATVVPTKRE